MTQLQLIRKVRPRDRPVSKGSKTCIRGEAGGPNCPLPIPPPTLPSDALRDRTSLGELTLLTVAKGQGRVRRGLFPAALL